MKPNSLERVNVILNPKVFAITIALLTFALIACLGFLGRALWRNYWWEQEVYGLAGMTASQAALEDFRNGKLRLRVVQGDDKEENNLLTYSGSNDGPFEVWISSFHPALGYPHRYSTEQQAAFYNRKMKYMHQNPEKFRPRTNILTGNAK
jgi:hypothetical protein